MCGILQEIITSNGKKFLVIGIGINIVSSPKIYTKYKATNLFFESKIKPTNREIINLITSSYENFFYNLNNYNFMNFKKKTEMMAFGTK